MEKLLKLINDNNIYDLIMDNFKVDNSGLEIDYEGLRDLVSKYDEFKECFIGLNLKGEAVKNLKSKLINGIHIHEFYDLLRETFLFDPTVDESNSLFTNYFDAIIYWYKIPIFVPIIKVTGTEGDSGILIDENLFFKVPIISITTNGENCTSSLEDLTKYTISENKFFSGDVGFDKHVFTMSSNMIYSPLVVTLLYKEVEYRDVLNKLLHGNGSIVDENEFITYLLNKGNPLSKEIAKNIQKYFLKAK